jgi:hypothetical protein
MNLALPGGSAIELDKDVLKTICDAAGTGALSIGITPVSTGSLPAEMQQALQGESVGAVFEISIKSGDKEISDLGGTARITFAVSVDSTVKSVKVYKIYPDGRVERVQAQLVNGEVTIERDSLSTYAVIKSDQPAWTNNFTDILIGQWYFDGIEYASQNNLMSGTSLTTFDPAVTTSRAMVATVLWRLDGKPAATKSNPFTDVKAGQWYTDAIAWAAENNIIGGIGGSLFMPDATVTREQIATMFYRYAVYKGYNVSAAASTNISAFADRGTISSFATEAMTWAYGEQILTGRTPTTLAPLGNAQRAELANMLRNLADAVSK